MDHVAGEPGGTARRHHVRPAGTLRQRRDPGLAWAASAESASSARPADGPRGRPGRTARRKRAAPPPARSACRPTAWQLAGVASTTRQIALSPRGGRSKLSPTSTSRIRTGQPGVPPRSRAAIRASRTATATGNPVTRSGPAGTPPPPADPVRPRPSGPRSRPRVPSRLSAAGWELHPAPPGLQRVSDAQVPGRAAGSAARRPRGEVQGAGRGGDGAVVGDGAEHVQPAQIDHEGTLHGGVRKVNVDVNGSVAAPCQWRHGGTAHPHRHPCYRRRLTHEGRHAQHDRTRLPALRVARRGRALPGAVRPPPTGAGGTLWDPVRLRLAPGPRRRRPGHPRVVSRGRPTPAGC